MLLFSAAAISLNSVASSEHARDEADKAIRVACLKASGLKDAKVVSGIIHYDDNVGYSTLLIAGRYPQPFIKNKLGKELCLYQRASKKAVVQEGFVE